MDRLVTVVFVFLCFHKVQSNDVPRFTLEDRIRALESQTIVPYMNRDAISRLEEKLLNEIKISTGRLRENPDLSFSLVERIDTIEKVLNKMCDRFDALVKGLSDEKDIRKNKISDIVEDTGTFKQLVEERQNEFESQIQSDLQNKWKASQEETTAFLNSIKDQQAQFKERLNSELKEERKNIQEEWDEFQHFVRENQTLFEDKLELKCRDENKEFQSSVNQQLDQIEYQFRTNEDFTAFKKSIALEQKSFQDLIKNQLQNSNQNFLKEHGEKLNKMEDDFRTNIGDMSETLNKLNKSLSILEVMIGCPPNWEKHHLMCYLFENKYEERVSWSFALQKCRKHGGTLAEVHGSDTLEFLNKHYGGRSWIGGADRETEGVWKWVESDVEIQYFDWGSGQPNSGGGNQDCLEIWKGRYNDNGCDWKYSYICQKPAGIHQLHD